MERILPQKERLEASQKLQKKTDTFMKRDIQHQKVLDNKVFETEKNHDAMVKKWYKTDIFLKPLPKKFSKEYFILKKYKRPLDRSLLLIGSFFWL